MTSPPAGIATFDSATAMLQALARFLHGRDFPALGQPWYMERAAPLVNLAPRHLREAVFSLGGWTEGVAPDAAGRVDAMAIAAWMAGLYPRRRYPAAMIGSSNGALVHACAALGVPWLPQTFLTLVRQAHRDPDDAREAMERGRPIAHALLEANPDVTLHHMHDPNQDRRMLRYIAYFRLKYRRLPPAYRAFLSDCLEPGATLYVVDCRRRWPLTMLGERYRFQFGAVGGADPEDYFGSDDRVTRYLSRYGEGRRWNPPVPNAEGPEAEWGYEASLDEGIETFAAECGYRVVRLTFCEPEDLSPLVADLHRRWYEERDIETDRLLVESFILLEPYWALRTGSVPFWMVFNVEPSVPRIRRYVEEAGPFDEIRMMLFAHGTDSLGLASIDTWRGVIGEARRIGTFVGVDQSRYPRDFATFARYHTALKALGARYPLPAPLASSWFEAFVRETSGRHGVRIEE